MRFDTTSEITFRKLSIFMTFMEKGNIARTAETLGLSGVSVHRALHTLEENVRCPLFTHKGRNLIALPSAWTLLEYCQEVMQVMERGLEESRKIAGIGQGRLRVGTLYSLTLETVPRLIMGMKLRRPDLEMDLTMGSNDTLLHMLDEGSLDAILISISESDIDRNSLEVLPLFHDDIFLAAPASATLNAHGPADLRDYKHQKFVALAEGFNNHTIEYYVENKNGGDKYLIAQATLAMDGTVDGRISNRSRDQVLEHYLAIIATVYDRLYDAMEQDQPVDLSHLALTH